MPAVETGHPAQITDSRAILLPVAPSGMPQPMKTSSTSAASMPALAMALLMACPPITAPWVWLKLPRRDLARPVRAVETITASFMGLFLAKRSSDYREPLRWQSRLLLSTGFARLNRRRIAQRHQDGDSKAEHTYADADPGWLAQKIHGRIGQRHGGEGAKPDQGNNVIDAAEFGVAPAALAGIL